MSMNGHHPI